MNFLSLIDDQEQFSKLCETLRKNITPVKVTGTAESQKLHLAVSLCQKFDKGMIYVVPEESSVSKAYDDALFFAGKNVYVYPEKDILFYNIEARSNETEEKRFETVNALLNTKKAFVITTPTALLQKIPSKENYKKSAVKIAENKEYEIDRLTEKLVKTGYIRENEVTAKGQFSVRGGILDIFPFASEFPYRVEFWDDTVDTIRTFDPLTQRSVENIKEFLVLPANEKFEKSEVSILDYAEKYFLFLDEPQRIEETAQNAIFELTENIKSAIEREYNFNTGENDPEYYFITYDKFLKKYSNILTVGLSGLSYNYKGLPVKDIFSFVTKSMPSYNGNTEFLCEDVMFYLLKRYKIVFPCGNEQSAKRLLEIFSENDIPAVWNDNKDALAKEGEVLLIPGKISAGFEYPLTQTAFISDEQAASGVKEKRRIRPKRKSNIRDINDIKSGDYVVHQVHGIGVYKGIHQLSVDGVTKDYLKIQYKGADILYVPVNQLNIINKYIGAETGIKVNKLGGSEWTKAKAKVKKSVEVLAKDLIELYAKRENAEGFKYSPDSELQTDFENTFIYDETEDQLTAIKQVKKDMERKRPMDRLLCGDVGYGKTEVAIRAAFKAVMDSKQVAYLVPTTLLARQHYETFCQRMKDFPVKVEMLSRFRTKKQQDAIIEELKNGRVDIVIGTHRILSDDVKFKDLGLLIVDEEQRFGVNHKEKIKHYKNNIDILTLTATPIPRTLNMAMTGLRDFSVLNDPPKDRHPVQTYVLEYNDEAVKNAIKKEVARGGQVYYLYNRVETIDSAVRKLQKMLPDVRFVVAHGKMTERELEKIMIDVMNKEYDVLVCTTIIETGLDIPNINTMIIEDSDRFGLSQLYQLRGRVGRSSRIAYCYLTVRKNKVLDETAERRLKAIKEYTEFGSGIKIAMRDLEIRGAGSVLGKSQHGHINQVGYDMYCKLLNDAVRSLKEGKETEEELPLTIDISVDSYIPSSYITDQITRIDVYKTIASIENNEDALSVTDELIDRFGDVPKSVLNLIDCALIRNMAEKLGIGDIVQKGASVVMRLTDRTDMESVMEYISENGKYCYLNSGKSISFIYNIPENNPYKVCKSLKNILTEILKIKGDEQE